MKRAAELAGLDPETFAGHSLRSGLATSAAAARASERSIMDQTGHRSVQMVRRYIRDGSLFRDNAATRWVCEDLDLRECSVLGSQPRGAQNAQQ